MKLRYELLQRGTTFTQFGSSPEKLISKHTSLAAAERAFNNFCGHCVLVEIYATQRTVINQALI